MIILAIDTSNAFSSVAISNKGEILYGFKDFDPNTQAERLITHIENALSSLNMDYSSINYLATCVGPGSFTGIRIALSAAKGIILARPEIKPVSITNFQTINFRIRQQYMAFDYAISTVDASRGQIYLQKFTKKEEFEPKILSYDEFINFLNNLEGNIVCAGSGLEKIFKINSDIPPNVVVLPRFPYPDARIIAQTSSALILKGKNNSKLEPLYIREPDAKIPNIKGVF